MIDAALLLLRSVTGGFLAGHGAQKLFGAFRGPGLEGTKGMMKSMGLEPSELWGTAAGVTEFAGGGLTALGLLSPLGPIVSLAPMITATTTVHWGKPVWINQGGAEMPLTNIAAAGALALSGPGLLSVDRALGIKVPRWISLATLAGVLGGSAAVVVIRSRQQARQAAEAEQAEPQVAQGAEEPEVELAARAERREAEQATARR